MNRTLIWTNAAADFWRLPGPVQERLTEALRRYSLTGEGDVKRMKGSRYLRLRDGDYRVVFVEGPDSLTVLAAGNRRDIYR